MKKRIFSQYWGKTLREDSQQIGCHLLIWHSLDVAAVASRWWEGSSFIRSVFCRNSSLLDETQVKAWVLFFIALHDIGKFDIRFQCKSVEAWRKLSQCDAKPSTLDYSRCQDFDHGAAGLYWFIEDYQPMQEDFDYTCFDEPEPHPLHSWIPWIEAVTGHHGYIRPQHELNDDNLRWPTLLSPSFAERDRQARCEWIEVLEALFLVPVGLSVKDTPPDVSPLMAGFCSIVDWLGSWVSEDTFLFSAAIPKTLDELRDYFDARCEKDAAIVLQRSGLLADAQPYQGVQKLLADGLQPRQLQILVDALPLEPGVTLIEAPTGSGKTETALAYAWRLIDANLADSIVFALPTQATANAMFERMAFLAGCLFSQPNLILAHGNARFNNDFQAIKQRGQNAQGNDEAWAQCCEWLALSNKRVFLGQIGICTIDQVLISVLPVKHRFIRGFGVGRSVLIVDEIHAFDTYMNGLLDAVLNAQYKAGGSAILLSATLPEQQRHQLLNNYGKSVASTDTGTSAPYPLINWRGNKTAGQWDLLDSPEHLPRRFALKLESIQLTDLMPDPKLIDRMLAAAHTGAQVCLICNLVDVAQKVCRELQQKSGPDIDVILFHSRFTLLDRQSKEENVLRYFGKNGDRSRGRILVSTQVVEQSLDVDFDWLITQHCPADLLFQRLGRLHRHERDSRPTGFSSPLATVLLPDQENYGLHSKIYGNVRVLWRTQQHLEALNAQPLYFPDAYREWLDVIYCANEADEPEWVTAAMDEYEMQQLVKRSKARDMLSWAARAPLNDSDEKIHAVTRDGEMSLSVVPYLQTEQGKQLLDGRIIEHLDAFSVREALALNRVNVPNSWRKTLDDPLDEHGVLWLKGRTADGSWLHERKGAMLIYTKESGMTRVIPNEAL
ncbi:CRISPR-associated helicase/endonuclease Cas3 [Atlantibacter subterranea]|uniref:CRISPR-associated helicase/endonuclease Cas3 n=1 Tax=Atlantibacter subterraneus TaxID=255519 RepID=UPI0020C282CB|nr:CRISPR-associated helicase/endonuclease Cas3 [Atlantibacter subterranea]UTJ48539.1 CRISPR-associated helicase/endonuclease Cas3 [Atlantibacter subterranea]